MKIFVVRMSDPFREEGYVYQANGYMNGLGKMQYSHLTRSLGNAMLFGYKNKAKLFLQDLNITDGYDLVEVSGLDIFVAKLSGKNSA